MNDADVIVLDVDGGGMLEECLAAVSRQTTAPSSVIVVDNGSLTPVAQRLDGSKYDILRSETNLGFAGGVNIALRHSRARYAALVNNDVVLDAGWLAAVLAAMNVDERLGAVQTVIRRSDSTIDGAGVDLSDGTIRQIGSGMPPGSVVPEAWGVSATAALYRRSAVGDRMFDERFFAYYEDVELCARLHQEGWHTKVLPVAMATHRGSASASLLRGEAKRLRTRNRYWVARLHPGTARIAALLREDARLLLRGRSSVRGILAGLFERL